MGSRALFSYRARYDIIELSNCRTEEQSEAEFFCAVWKRNGVITEQARLPVLTVLEHGRNVHCSLIMHGLHNGK